MKHLGNCSPKEFLRQTNRIRREAERWLDLTKLMRLRRPLPEGLDELDEAARRAAVAERVRESVRGMLDAVLEEHPDETAELLGLMCFIEPEELEAHNMAELIGSLGEMLGSQEIMDFFTSLARWGRTNTCGAAGR